MSVSIKGDVSNRHQRDKAANFWRFGVAAGEHPLGQPAIGGVQNAVWVRASTACSYRKPNEQEGDPKDGASDRSFHEELPYVRMSGTLLCRENSPERAQGQWQASETKVTAEAIEKSCLATSYDMLID